MTDKMQIKRDVKEKKTAIDNPNGIGTAIWHLILIHQGIDINLRFLPYQLNPRYESFLTKDLRSTIRYKSRIHIVRHWSNLFGVRIHDHDTIRIHIFKIILFDSFNLNILTIHFDSVLDYVWLNRKCNKLNIIQE